MKISEDGGYRFAEVLADAISTLFAIAFVVFYVFINAAALIDCLQRTFND